ncbi:MAG: rRNA (cytidine1920-2-O)/16S rRNA (cytidine1409-2-O)-methyltransferase [Acidobacteriota bacterium]|jgi:23S rRNA (cytidine1920-2'-O)/16S rRNA (cytidine1409-2'-O)-methyltransferase|nr:rRNA (cytidine1920-2-O)/16S rRNA (cytidine1409-2-O)-methyltransferase [Acidobacteriota bacterium]
MKKQRLDVALVERGLVDSRAKAQSLIMARRILVNSLHVDKAGAPVAEDDELRIEALEHPWVGRGGMKLAHAVDQLALDVAGKTCVDIGASTGGFTDVLLQKGARKVYAIDVGHGQLDVSLVNDPRVVNRERVNARYLQPENFDEPIDFVSIDVSFISLKLILPAVAGFLRGQLVALIKPQFEVGKHEVGKGGIVRDVAKRQEAVHSVVQFAREHGFDVKNVLESPIKGAEGNVEFLMHAIADIREDPRATTPDEHR